MEGQSSSSNSQYQYQWQRLVRRNTVTNSPTPSSTPSLALPPQIQTQLDLLPILLPQHESYHQAQLAHYNRLLASSTSINSSRTAGAVSQALPLPPLLSPHHIQAVPRSRSSSRGGSTAKPSKSSSRVGHGNKEPRKVSKGERALITERGASATMPMENLDLTGQIPTRPLVHHQDSSLSHQSNSYPSTPLQQARKFSFDRETSPQAADNHSPRSAYSESHIVLPPKAVPAPRGICRYETAGNKFMRRMPYSIGNEKLDDANLSEIKENLTDEENKKLTADMEELYSHLLPTPQSDTRREALVSKLEKLFNDEWPGHNIRVHVFGSSGNLLCTDDSDVDICITTDWKELESVCKIADLLARNGMENVVCVSYAKVPIVKIWDPKLHLACDMNVNNTLALENTRMIKTYIQVNPRVRPLAMIIKHWTKRRILNDAAFGGTLSSYTWICMIINFLQTRTPAVLPNLHQTQSNKTSPSQQTPSFIDDVKTFKGFGDENKESLGDLLFGFLRFYAYEFDYENLVVSIRSGGHTSKVDKGWHLATNNRLCVEEPFNIGRNLANTADDFSWRGLHLELRRAFDLISHVKLAECCEQYTIPKVQVTTNTFEKPTQSKKPVLRSASQSNRGGRGNHRGGRHNNQNGRNASGNRRASSGQFDSTLGYVPGIIPPNMSVQEAWLQRQAQAQLHNDLYATYSVLQAQENSLRLQLYNQSQQYLQAQNQAFAQSQAQNAANASGNKQQTERNRTSSFDQPPLSAPIRPQDMYYYPLHFQPAPIYGYQTASTNPSSPSLSNAVPEHRRGVHRSTVTNGSSSIGSASSSLRSHSQPASRSNPAQLHMHAQGGTNPGLGIYATSQQANTMPVPSFIADENGDNPVEPMPLQTAASSPDDPTPKEYVGYYVSDSALNPSHKQSLVAMPIPSFGDLKQNRRLSTDRLPQSVRDILQRSSRSPSPLGHDRSYSTNTHPAAANALHLRQSVSSTNLQALNNQAPPIANGSLVAAPISIPQWQATMIHKPPYSEDQASSVRSTSLESSSNLSGISSDLGADQTISGQSTPRELRQDRPLVVNGSNPSASESVSPEPVPICLVPSYPVGVQNGLGKNDQANGNSPLRLSPSSRNRLSRQTQNGGVSPLDIGLSQSELLREDLPHLSPVYETRTPSPRTTRKFEPPFDRKSNGVGTKVSVDAVTPQPVSAKNAAQVPSQNTAPTQSKVNGHTRASKSEGGNAGAWQKAGGKKKKPAASESTSSINGQSFSEKPPRKDSDRRGG